ncbi:MAG: hypothetical protein Ct9H300mP6_13920 [Gammaproteobacteria bacterium]|nr:MAG: hypothetical protein Ct9H300mP6_13920 [Gammaproteobacteria bacterium]
MNLADSTSLTLKGPFYSIRMSGWSLCSFAGLGVNGNFEVTKPSESQLKIFMLSVKLLVLGFNFR